MQQSQEASPLKADAFSSVSCSSTVPMRPTKSSHVSSATASASAAAASRRSEADEAAILTAFRQRLTLASTGGEGGGDGGVGCVANSIGGGGSESGSWTAMDDFNLRRWLTARDWNLEAAVDMFEANRRFQAEMRPEELLASYQPPEVLRRYLPGGFVGFDRDGGPVRLELFGALDMPGLLRSCTWADMQRAKLVECETAVQLCQAQTRRLGRQVPGMTVIFDMTGASAKFLWPPGIAAYMRMVRMLEDNYPELVHRLLVINCPSVFPVLYRVCRPLLTQGTRDKISILTGNRAAVTAALTEKIAPDQLPAYLGGERLDANGDPRCSAEVCQGGRVPSKYYLETAAASKAATAERLPADTT